MNARPRYSILHPSARPEQWQQIHDAWMAACIHPHSVEYILCCDRRWGFDASNLSLFDGDCFSRFQRSEAVWNEGRRCYVDAVNTAARAATGEILIVIADDLYPCEDWDVELEAIVTARAKGATQFVIEVSTGTVREHERGILVLPILSQARYRALGYVFYPAYESMYADNDFCEHARQDGVLLDARELEFLHRHPLIELEQHHLGETVDQATWEKYVDPVAWDAQYRAQHDPAAYDLGKRILGRRREERFQATADPKNPRILALCLPGESFSAAWVGAVLAIQQYLTARGWAVFVHQAYSSIAYYTRQALIESLAAQVLRPEMVLWLDDDNIPSVEAVQILLEDLEAAPELDSVAGWYWLDGRDGTFRTSAGISGPRGVPEYAAPEAFRDAQGLVEVAWHGFGCVLMRYRSIEQAGELPFAAIPAPGSRYGMTGEDVSFCVHAAERGGVKFFIDPRVFVPHVKLGTIGPAGYSKSQALPTVVATLRVKNEASNIRRCLEALKPVAKTLLVLDDHSTDDTALIADECGATVYASPFPDRDEGRDRQFLLERAREAGADWILAIDADEVLDPRDVANLMTAIRFSGADALHFRWLHFWDRPDQIRTDGIYSRSSPLRAYRVTAALRLASISNGVHTWPEGEIGRAFADVRLWHFGYLDRSERLRKYAFYNAVDPANQAEDCYRHIVQGDIPESPADAVLGKAGPLTLERLASSALPEILQGPAGRMETKQ